MDLFRHTLRKKRPDAFLQVAEMLQPAVLKLVGKAISGCWPRSRSAIPDWYRRKRFTVMLTDNDVKNFLPCRLWSHGWPEFLNS